MRSTVTPAEQADKNKRTLLAAIRHGDNGRIPTWGRDGDIKIRSSNGQHTYTVELSRAANGRVVFACDHHTQAQRSHHEILISSPGVTQCWHQAAAAALHRSTHSDIELTHIWQWATRPAAAKAVLTDQATQ